MKKRKMIKNGNGMAFVTITNREIWDRLDHINLDYNLMKDKNEAAHNEIKNLISGYKGQVIRLYWALGSLSVILMALFGVLIQHIAK
jgi:hypothetical protein